LADEVVTAADVVASVVDLRGNDDVEAHSDITGIDEPGHASFKGSRSGRSGVVAAVVVAVVVVVVAVVAVHEEAADAEVEDAVPKRAEEMSRFILIFDAAGCIPPAVTDVVGACCLGGALSAVVVVVAVVGVTVVVPFIVAIVAFTSPPVPGRGCEGSMEE